jgi:hypothetical protein
MFGILATVFAGVALAGAATLSVVHSASGGPGSSGAPTTQTITYDEGK